MATTASDTGNEFADAWDAADIAAARNAGLPQAVAPSADANAEVNDYRTAWEQENLGNYGDIEKAPLQSAVDAAAPAAAPAAPAFRQTAFQLTAPNSLPGSGDFTYDSRNRGAIGAPGYSGGYGSWQYGTAAPEYGTDAFKDYQAYWDNDGYDTADLYGKRDQSIAAMKAKGINVTDMATWGSNMDSNF